MRFMISGLLVAAMLSGCGQNAERPVALEPAPAARTLEPAPVHIDVAVEASPIPHAPAAEVVEKLHEEGYALQTVVGPEQKVTEGSQVEISLDARPEKKLKGEVAAVALKPDGQEVALIEFESEPEQLQAADKAEVDFR